MSACISREGEYSDHVLDGTGFICTRCGTFDEAGCLAEVERLRYVLTPKPDVRPWPTEQVEWAMSDPNLARAFIAAYFIAHDMLTHAGVEDDGLLERIEDVLNQRDEAATAERDRILALLKQQQDECVTTPGACFCEGLDRLADRIAETTPEEPTDA